MQLQLLFPNLFFFFFRTIPFPSAPGITQQFILKNILPLHTFLFLSLSMLSWYNCISNGMFMRAFLYLLGKTTPAGLAKTSFLFKLKNKIGEG